MRILNNKVDLDLSANSETQAYDVSHIVYYSVHISITGSPNYTGTFTLQCSNNLDDVWIDIPSASQAILSGDDGVMFNVQNSGYKYVKLVWSYNTGNQGDCVVIINQKGFQT